MNRCVKCKAPKYDCGSDPFRTWSYHGKYRQNRGVVGRGFIE